MSAVKFDQDKPLMSLLPFDALRAVAQILTFGAKKYGHHNWKGGMDWSRVQSAMLRHYEQFSEGEDVDKESGLLHTAHLACNALFLLAYQLKGKGNDDRYKEIAKNKSAVQEIEEILSTDSFSCDVITLCSWCNNIMDCAKYTENYSLEEENNFYCNDWKCAKCERGSKSHAKEVILYKVSTNLDEEIK
jgi:hypothetical protein